MKDDAEAKRLVKAGLLGDHYFHAVVQGDPRMEGFAVFAGQGYETVPLAADPEAMQPEADPRYAADVSFIGANLPTKREVIDEWLLPLGQRYDLKVYGPDWTRRERVVGFVAKVGQYFNVPVVRSLQKPELPREDEARVFASSKVLVNLHEDHQRQFGGDCNERTFKIPFCAGSRSATTSRACATISSMARRSWSRRRATIGSTRSTTTSNTPTKPKS